MPFTVETMKSLLKTYNRKNILFNEPHFSRQMALRQGNKEEVFQQIFHPERLIHVEKQGRIKYALYFKVSGTRTLKLPVLVKRKNLYILTYIMRYRKWHKKKKVVKK